MSRQAVDRWEALQRRCDLLEWFDSDNGYRNCTERLERQIQRSLYRLQYVELVNAELGVGE